MITAKLYGKALLNALLGRINWTGGGIKVALFTSAYVPNIDTDEFFDTLLGEVSSEGTGYTAGGVALANPTATYDADTDTITLDADNVSLADVTLDARYVVIYDSAPVANKPLIGYADLAEDYSPRASTCTINWAETGILKVSPNKAPAE